MTTVLKYKTNLNCGSCVAAVQPHLDGDSSIERWSLSVHRTGPWRGLPFRFRPVVTNFVTFVVMLVGIVGVSQALFQKQRIQCACLGTVFNLPMSKVTFIEDGLRATMAATMLWMLFIW